MILENVAETILSADKPVSVVDSNGAVVGTVKASRIIQVLFGNHSTNAVGSVT